MSFHPNDVRRRGIAANVIVALVLIFLGAGFFRTQVLQHAEYTLQSETNRLREVPLPAPRGVIYDRSGKIIAENVLGYSVSVLAQREDTLRAVLQRLTGTIIITARADRAGGAPLPARARRADRHHSRRDVRRRVRARGAPDEFPGLIIQSAPRAVLSRRPVVAPSSATPARSARPSSRSPRSTDYKAGQQVGKQGLERQYESSLRGQEGSRFVEVDARGRVVRGQGGARPDLAPDGGTAALHEHRPRSAALRRRDLRRLAAWAARSRSIRRRARCWRCTAHRPRTRIGSSAASRRSTGTRCAPTRAARCTTRRCRGAYPPGSTWKLATAVIGLENGAVRMNEHLPISVHRRHAVRQPLLPLLGQARTRQPGPLGSDREVVRRVLLPARPQARPRAPDRGRRQPRLGREGGNRPAGGTAAEFPESIEYFNREVWCGNWSQSVVLNLAIGQGDNAQTILNMAKFYTALARPMALPSRPQLVRAKPRARRRCST